MADDYGVLGTQTGITVGTHTVYTVPVGHAARVRLQAIWKAASNSDVGILVNGAEVARTGAMTVDHYCYTNGGAGLLVAPGANKPTGATAAATVQPGPANNTYWLSSGDTIQYTVTTANLQAMAFDVVGTVIEL